MKKYKLIKEYPKSPLLGTIGHNPTNHSSESNLELGAIKIVSERICFEKFPEFWQEVVEQEYEIVSFKMLASFEMTGRIFSDCSDSKYKLEWYLGEVKAKRAEIYSIKRLSDGEIFTLGDRINFSDHIANITAFKPELGVTFVETYRVKDQANLKGYSYWSIDTLTKAKEPLFTTEDGVDIFEGDKLPYWVPIKDGEESTIDSEANWKAFDGVHQYNLSSYNKKYWKIFSTKEKAQEYIDFHKKQYSLDQIQKAIKNCGYAVFTQYEIINKLKNEKS